MYKLFLDDIRDPLKLYPDQEWVIARTYQEFIDIIIDKGVPDEVSFDNDLGEEMEGYDALKWMVNNDIRTRVYRVHTDNSVNSENISIYAKNWLNHLIDEGLLDPELEPKPMVYCEMSMFLMARNKREGLI